MTPLETVNAFIAAAERLDLDAALELLTDDVEYHNVPMDPVYGHQGVREVLGMFMGGASEVHWVIHRQAANDNVVFNERTDRFCTDGRWLEVPVAGVWELRDGKIALWRDYFDLKRVTDQMAPTPDPS